MKLATIVTTGLATLALAACAKGSDPVSQAVNHAGDEAQKKATQAQMTGKWLSSCDQKGLLWAAAGIKSEQIQYDFYNNAGKTSKLFSDDNCQTQVGSATYTGTATVGAPSAVDNSNILDLNYTNVSLTITDQATVNLLNSPLVPGCGINDWALNAARDVTAASGGATCPIAKPAQVFDIVKTDGQSLHFGMADAAHTKLTQDQRPVQLNTTDTYTKQH